MGQVAEGGRTVLFVSHNMAAVQHLCSRAVLLRDGLLVADGGVSHVIAGYYEDARSDYSKRGAYGISKVAFTTQSDKGFRITEIELFKTSGEPLDLFRTGDGLIVRIHYEAARLFRSPAFAVQIRTELGVELVRLNTRPISGYDIGEIVGRGYIDLTIDSLPLTAGQYYLDVGFARERQHWIQRMEDVIKLYVEPNDVYGSGMALDETRGLFVVPHDWEHRASNQATIAVAKPV